VYLTQEEHDRLIARSSELEHLNTILEYRVSSASQFIIAALKMGTVSDLQKDALYLAIEKLSGFEQPVELLPLLLEVLLAVIPRDAYLESERRRNHTDLPVVKQDDEREFYC